MPSRRRVLVFSACSLSARFSVAEPTPSVMRVSTLLEEDPATQVAERILQEAYRRLGITLQVQAMPGERSLISANSGVTDGELYRKEGIENTYPQLIRVPVPLLTYEIVVFKKGPPIPVESWDSLKPYRIGFVKGIKIIEEKTVGMAVQPVATLHQAFTMLDLNRTDVVLANRLSGLASLRAHKFHEVHMLRPPLAAFEVFHYVHKKHAALVPSLTAVLKEMEKTHVLQRIQEDVLAAFS